MAKRDISIWFFAGILLLGNGVLVLAGGIQTWVHPPATPVALHRLHAGVWWGLLLCAAGGLYCLRNRPRAGAPETALPARSETRPPR